MDDLSELLSVIGLFYDSVIDEAKWPEALQSLADFAGGTGLGYVVADPIAGAIVHCESVSIDPKFNKLYLEHYSSKEVRLLPALPYEVGDVLTEVMLLERRTLERSEIFGELLAPCDVPHFMFAWLQKKPHAFQTLAIEGSERHGAFGREAVERFSRVMPHLVRAVRMRELLASVRQSHRAYSRVLETLPFGVVFLDEKGEVIRATAPAERVLRCANGLVQTQNRVRATHVDDNLRLQRVIQNTVRARCSRTTPGSTIVIRRTNDQRSLVVTVIPVLSPEFLTITPHPAGLLLIVDPELTPRPRTALIQSALCLTQAEAALANTLFDGISLREAAEILGSSVNTCKTQLKSIYAKTGCRSHTDLAKSLLLTALGQASE